MPLGGKHGTTSPLRRSQLLRPRRVHHAPRPPLLCLLPSSALPSASPVMEEERRRRQRRTRWCKRASPAPAAGWPSSKMTAGVLDASVRPPLPWRVPWKPLGLSCFADRSIPAACRLPCRLSVYEGRLFSKRGACILWHGIPLCCWSRFDRSFPPSRRTRNTTRVGGRRRRRKGAKKHQSSAIQ